MAKMIKISRWGRIQTVALLDATWIGSSEPTQRKRMGDLVVEDDIEEGAAHVQLVVVVNEALFAELIHEETE